jgi:hypothetical protein
LILLDKECIAAMLTDIYNHDRAAPRSDLQFFFAWREEEVLKSRLAADFSN